jgi:hypothetical protein
MATPVAVAPPEPPVLPSTPLVTVSRATQFFGSDPASRPPSSAAPDKLFRNPKGAVAAKLDKAKKKGACHQRRAAPPARAAAAHGTPS